MYIYCKNVINVFFSHFVEAIWFLIHESIIRVCVCRVLHLIPSADNLWWLMHESRWKRWGSVRSHPSTSFRLWGKFQDGNCTGMCDVSTSIFLSHTKGYSCVITVGSREWSIVLKKHGGSGFKTNWASSFVPVRERILVSFMLKGN